MVPTATQPARLSDELEQWCSDEASEKTLGGLVDAFGENSFAILFVLLLGVPALPVPTAGATHVFEVIAALVALQLIAGRRTVWLPQRWRALRLGGERQQRFLNSLLRFIRRLERFSRPRLVSVLRHRLSDIGFGLLVIGGSAAAFVAPPFSGLDTLPALGVVLVALGMLLEDALIAGAGAVLGVAGVALEVVLGAAAVHGIESLL